MPARYGPFQSGGRDADDQAQESPPLPIDATSSRRKLRWVWVMRRAVVYAPTAMKAP